MRWTAASKVIAVGLLALLFILAVTDASWPEGDMDETTSEDVGEVLFGTSEEDQGYGLAFFLIGLLLLVAMLGGIFLAKEESE